MLWLHDQTVLTLDHPALDVAFSCISMQHAVLRRPTYDSNISRPHPSPSPRLAEDTLARVSLTFKSGPVEPPDNAR